MKAIVTLIFVLFIGISAQARPVAKEVKVAVITKGILIDMHQGASLKNEGSVARLYLFKNSRVKKELSFITKRNISKLA